MGKSLQRTFSECLRSSAGVTTLEYAILAALVALAIVASVTATGQVTATTFVQVGNLFPN